MVKGILSASLDPVAKRLTEGNDGNETVVLQWLTGEQLRLDMRRRAKWCAVAGWLLVSLTAIAGSAIAAYFGHYVQQLFIGDVFTELTPPLSIAYTPKAMMIFAGLVVIVAPFAWLVGRVPGYSKTLALIDWSASSDAVNRLLSVGCAYPEAFRTAAKLTTTKPSRRWLLQAADRIERGGDAIEETAGGTVDSLVLESLVGTAGVEPQDQWQIASEHFLDVAQRRLVLLLQSTPMIATIVSGLVLWISISVTIGWMWRIAAQMIRGLT